MDNIKINEIEEMLSPKVEFRASESLKEQILSNAKELAKENAVSMMASKDEGTKDRPKVVMLKPKVNRGLIIGVASVAACLLICFLLWNKGRANDEPQQMIAETEKSAKPIENHQTERKEPSEVLLEPIEAEVVETPLTAQVLPTKTVKEPSADEETIEVKGDDDATLLLDSIPFLDPQVMDNCIARLSDKYEVKGETFQCGNNASSGKIETAYNFPDKPGNNIMAQMIQTACWYMQQNQSISYIYSKDQFILQIQNGRLDSLATDTWQAERKSGRIYLYRTHTIGYDYAPSTCLMEYKEKTEPRNYF